MCGRYVQTKRARAKAQLLALREVQAEAARAETWNLTPSTLSLVVRARGAERTADWLSWGLEGTGLLGMKPINARIESAAEKASFREAWKSQRCVVPVDGWYEWRMMGGQKQPYYFYRRDGEPLFFGGLWSGETFCLLTTEANGDLARVHDRRPLALRDGDARSWLETTPSSAEKVVFCAVPPVEIAFHPVSTLVSSPRNEGPQLIEPVTLTPVPTQADLF
jgi:putative SOS response-associated peptidase YedK